MKALFLGCHCDDIELGCGGTIHKHKDWEVHCAVLCNHGYFDGELKNIKSYAQESLSNLGVTHQYFGGFIPDEFSQQRQKIWEYLSNLKKIQPQIVFVQSNDEHPDHKLLNQESIRIFRNTTVLSYHVTRSQQCFPADTFEELSAENVETKLRSVKIYHSLYKTKNYLTPENAISQLRFNGIYPGFEFAECYKTIIRIGI